MLVIRYFRIGKRNQPSFKIVVTDKRRAARGGRFVEEVGFWNSLTKEKIFKKERIQHWISVGAKPSPTVHNLLVGEKIIDAKKINVSKRPKSAKGGKTAETIPATSAPVPAEARAGTAKAPEAPQPTAPAEKPAQSPAEPAKPEKKPTEESKPEKEKKPDKNPAGHPDGPAAISPEASSSGQAKPEKPVQ